MIIINKFTYLNRRFLKGNYISEVMIILTRRKGQITGKYRKEHLKIDNKEKIPQ